MVFEWQPNFGPAKESGQEAGGSLYLNDLADGVNTYF